MDNLFDVRPEDLKKALQEHMDSLDGFESRLRFAVQLHRMRSMDTTGEMEMLPGIADAVKEVEQSVFNGESADIAHEFNKFMIAERVERAAELNSDPGLVIYNEYLILDDAKELFDEVVADTNGTALKDAADADLDKQLSGLDESRRDVYNQYSDIKKKAIESEVVTTTIESLEEVTRRLEAEDTYELVTKTILEGKKLEKTEVEDINAFDEAEADRYLEQQRQEREAAKQSAASEYTNTFEEDHIEELREAEERRGRKFTREESIVASWMMERKQYSDRIFDEAMKQTSKVEEILKEATYTDLQKDAAELIHNADIYAMKISKMMNMKKNNSQEFKDLQGALEKLGSTDPKSINSKEDLLSLMDTLKGAAEKYNERIDSSRFRGVLTNGKNRRAFSGGMLDFAEKGMEKIEKKKYAEKTAEVKTEVREETSEKAAVAAETPAGKSVRDEERSKKTSIADMEKKEMESKADGRRHMDPRMKAEISKKQKEIMDKRRENDRSTDKKNAAKEKV